MESTTRKFKSEYNCSNNKYKFKVFHEQIYTVSIIKKFKFNTNIHNCYVFMGKCALLTGAKVPFLELMCQKSRGKCVIFRANVQYLTGANVLRANE